MTRQLNNAEARQAWLELLTRLGIRRGQCICIGIDMSKVPLPHIPVALDRAAMKVRNESWCGFVLETLFNFLGPEGTVIVPSFTYSCGVPGGRYVHEESASETGPFTEFVRKHADAVRSLHPIFSLSGIGEHAREILENVGGSAFGPSSPYGKMAGYDTSFVCLGVPFRFSVTYIHHLEQSYGCNHRFNKVLDIPVFRNSRRVERQWLAYLRYRGVECEADLLALEQKLIASGALKVGDWQGAPFQSVALADVDAVGYTMLIEDSCAFASRKVVIGFDETLVAATPSSNPFVKFKLSF